MHILHVGGNSENLLSCTEVPHSTFINFVSGETASHTSYSYVGFAEPETSILL